MSWFSFHFHASVFYSNKREATEELKTSDDFMCNILLQYNTIIIHTISNIHDIYMVRNSGNVQVYRLLIHVL